MLIYISTNEKIYIYLNILNTKVYLRSLPPLLLQHRDLYLHPLRLWKRSIIPRLRTGPVNLVRVRDKD
jgi:hypothetical protein